ncbi:cysteine hydrolase family protein [Isoptericola sp. NPDC057191]|uniref:cysteine hydrolase family protein n=1 Tax=Isoptericola sp. NPDC057191 TaxID=3346041 RepID=UPI00363697CB
MPVPRRALVVVDAQQEYFDGGALPVQYPPREGSLARILEALDAADASDVPVVVVRHELPAGSPVFAAGSATWQLHPEIERRAASAAARVTKSYSSIFAGTDLESWAREHDVDTLTLVGYMTNNCVLASAAAAEPLGLTVEVLSDATGAVDLANEAGTAPARQVHETLMTLLHSNWARVADTTTWAAAVKNGHELEGSDLGTSAAQGRSAR